MRVVAASKSGSAGDMSYVGEDRDVLIEMFSNAEDVADYDFYELKEENRVELGFIPAGKP